MRLGFVLDYDASNWREVAEALWDAVQNALREERVVYWKFGICVPEERQDVYDFYRSRATYLDPADGHEPAFMRCRSELSITEPLEGVLSGLPTKTRYMVNKAQKYGLEVETGTLEDIEKFQELKVETAKRDNIEHLSLDDMKTIFNTIVGDGLGTFYFVRIRPTVTLAILEKDLQKWQRDLERAEGKKKRNENYINDVCKSIEKIEAQVTELRELEAVSPEGMLLSGGLCVTVGNTMMYNFAASSDRFRDYFPNYLMLWSFITRAKEQGCTLFDFAETYEDETQGLGLFKSKRGATTVKYSGDFEQVVSHPAGDVFRMLMHRRG